MQRQKDQILRFFYCSKKDSRNEKCDEGKCRLERFELTSLNQKSSFARIENYHSKTNKKAAKKSRMVNSRLPNEILQPLCMSLRGSFTHTCRSGLWIQLQTFSMQRWEFFYLYVAKQPSAAVSNGMTGCCTYVQTVQATGLSQR